MVHLDLVVQSIEELRLKTAAHDQVWHLGDADWSADQDTGKIVFSSPKGVTTEGSVQIIGTFDSNDSTWLWAWDHPSVLPSLQVHAKTLHAYGEANGIGELTTRKLSTTLEKCWEFTALACKLNNAQGGYRGPSGTTFVFMTFDDLKLGCNTNNQLAACNETIADESLSEFTSDIPTAVRSTLIGFIKALYDWEVAAYEASESGDKQTSREITKANYLDLIRKWCVPDLTPQSMSFGNDPGHNPDREHLVAAATTEDQCRVRTQHTKHSGFVTEYEYHLQFQDGRWLVENLFYIDDDDKFEML